MTKSKRRLRGGGPKQRLPVAALKADACTIARQVVEASEAAAAEEADGTTTTATFTTGGAAAAAPQVLSALHRLHGVFLTCDNRAACLRVAAGAASEGRAPALLDACADLTLSGDALAYLGAEVPLSRSRLLGAKAGAPPPLP